MTAAQHRSKSSELSDAEARQMEADYRAEMSADAVREEDW